MKDRLGRKFMTEFVALRTKKYSYLTDDVNNDKKGKGTKKCVIKRILKFNIYTNCSLNNEIMVNYDNCKIENKTEHNPKWTCIPDHPSRILIIGGSGSGKTNPFFNLIYNQPDIDKIYLYAKCPYEAKYQHLINNRRS